MSAWKGDKQYTSQLDEASKARAKKELNERNDKDRDSAVRALQNWASEQNWLRTPMDYEFLLRFLRVRKFSQLEARKSIEKYWTLKTKAPKMYMDMDPTDPVMQELLRKGIFYSPMKRDKDGCRVMICPLGRIPLNRVKSDLGPEPFYKLFALVTEWVLLDENTQVNGLKMVWENTDMSLPLVKAFINPGNNQFVMKFLDKCIPARVKGIYTYNEPAFVDIIMSLFTPFMSKKLRDRVCGEHSFGRFFPLALTSDLCEKVVSGFERMLCKYWCGKARKTWLKTTGSNLTKLYQYIDKDVLPEEYLDDDYTGPNAGPEKQVIEEMISDMTSPKFLNHIREMSSSKYGVDLKSKPNEEQEKASFRKLNID